MQKNYQSNLKQATIAILYCFNAIKPFSNLRKLEASKILIIISFLLQGLVSSASVRYVSTTGQNGTGGHDGTTWAKAFLTLKYAVETAPATDTVKMAGGFYSVPSSGSSSQTTIIVPPKLVVIGSLDPATNVYDPVANPSVLDFAAINSTGDKRIFSQAVPPTSSELFTLQGLVLQNYTNPVSTGMVSLNLSGIVVAKVTLRDVVVNNVFYPLNFNTANPADFLIDNCVFKQVWNRSVITNVGGTITIRNSHFTHFDPKNVHAGGLLELTGNATTRTNINITGSSFCNTDIDWALLLTYVAGTISDSWFTGNDGGGIGNESFSAAIYARAPAPASAAAYTDIQLNKVTFYYNRTYATSSNWLETNPNPDITAGKDGFSKFSSITNSNMQLAASTSYTLTVDNSTHSTGTAGPGVYNFGAGNRFNNISMATAPAPVIPGDCPAYISGNFAFNCGGAGAGLSSGSFIAGTASSGTLRVPITSSIVGPISISVAGSNITSNPAPYTASIANGATFIDIPVKYDGLGSAGSRTLTITSASGTGTCSINVQVNAACAATSGTLQ